jgi:hypothetical protein
MIRLQQKFKKLTTLELFQVQDDALWSLLNHLDAFVSLRKLRYLKLTEWGSGFLDIGSRREFHSEFINFTIRILDHFRLEELDLTGTMAPWTHISSESGYSPSSRLEDSTSHVWTQWTLQVLKSDTPCSRRIDALLERNQDLACYNDALVPIFKALNFVPEVQTLIVEFLSWKTYPSRGRINAREEWTTKRISPTERSSEQEHFQKAWERPWTNSPLPDIEPKTQDQRKTNRASTTAAAAEKLLNLRLQVFEEKRKLRAHHQQQQLPISAYKRITVPGKEYYNLDFVDGAVLYALEQKRTK